jgi:hypothetical protein
MALVDEEAPTWAQAVTDGTLVDVTTDARLFGIKCKVALTRAAWAACVMATPEEMRCGLWPLARRRLLVVAIRAAMERAPESAFTVRMWHTVERGPFGTTLHHLEVIASPGDAGEFVITCALVNE